jgi:hypothetical protein
MLYAESPDKIKVGAYEENTTWKNTALDQTLLWDILQDPASRKVLSVNVQAERRIKNSENSDEQETLFVPAAPEITQQVVAYIQRALQEWRTNTNYFLPDNYKLPYVVVISQEEEDDFQEEQIIPYSVLITTDSDRRVVGRAGYWADGSRSAMLLPILRSLELYFSTKNRLAYITDDKQRRFVEQRMQNYLENYMHAAADMVANQYDRDHEKEYANFRDHDPLEAWTEKSFSPFARILRTVIIHEFGHHLGLGHGGSDTIMARSVNEKPSSKTHVTETDGQRMAVLACYIHNNQPDADEANSCTPYKKPHKK